MRSKRLVPGVFLGLAAAAFALGPVALPDYDPVALSVSESAAQGVPGAWVARAGFPLLAVAVWSVLPHLDYGRVSRTSYRIFAAGLIGVAIWSHEPYLPGRDYDHVEALLHSVVASGMGFAIVNAELFAARYTRKWRHLALAILYLGLPLAMSVLPELAGVLQRLMFVTLIANLAFVSWGVPPASEGAIRGGSTQRA